MRKKLLTLLACLSLANPVFSQELKYEKDPFKFIPEDALVYAFDLYIVDGIMDTYWWDKNKDKYPQDDEIFIDLNQDMLPDISFEDLKKFDKKKKEEKEEDELIIL